MALRVGLASALAGAAAAAQTARLGALVARRARCRRSRTRASTALVGAAAGLAFGLSYAAAFQAVRPEVYALSALLRGDGGATRSRAGTRPAIGGGSYTAALAAGLALSNHHLLALTFALPAALLVAPRAGWRASVRALAVAGGTIAAVWAYLPLRAARHPLVDWGAPTTLVAHLVDGERARVPEGGGARPGRRRRQRRRRRWRRELWLVGAFLALGGAYVLVRLGRTAAGARAPRRRARATRPRRRSSASIRPTPTPTAISKRRSRCSPRSAARSSRRSRPPRSGRASCAPSPPRSSSPSPPAAWPACARFSRAPLLGHRRHARPLPRRRAAARARRHQRLPDHLRALVSHAPSKRAGPTSTSCIAISRLSRLSRRDRATACGDVSREPDVRRVRPRSARRAGGALDHDLPSLTIDEPQTRRYAAWQAYLGADRACRLASGAAAQPAIDARARALVAAVAKLRSHPRSGYDRVSMKPQRSRPNSRSTTHCSRTSRWRARRA